MDLLESDVFDALELQIHRYLDSVAISYTRAVMTARSTFRSLGGVDLVCWSSVIITNGSCGHSRCLTITAKEATVLGFIVAAFEVADI
jgi:hypothetical protein